MAKKTVLADNFCQNKALLNRIGIIFNLLTSGIGIFAPEWQVSLLCHQPPIPLLQDMIKRLLLYATALSVSLVLAIKSGQLEENSALLGQYAQTLSLWLENQLKEASSVSFPATVQEDKPHTVVIHKADSVAAWTNTRALPPARELKKWAASPAVRLVSLPSGWFLAKTDDSGDGTCRSVVIPIRYGLDFSNSDDKIVFPADPGIPAALRVSASKTEWPVTANGTVVCWLSANAPLQSGWILWLKFAAWTIFFLVFFRLLSETARSLSARAGAPASAVLIFSIIGGLLVFNKMSSWTSTAFAGISVFDYRFSENSLIGLSVGDWFVNAVLFAFLMAYVHRNYPSRSLGHLGFGAKAGVAILCNLALLAAVPLVMAVSGQLAGNEGGFNFDRFLDIGLNGFVALGALLVLIAALFLFGHRMMLTVRSLELARPVRLGVALSASLAVALIAASAGLNPLTAAVIAVLYAGVMDTFVHWQDNGFGWVVVWTLLFAGTASVLLQSESENNDRLLRLRYAEELVSERDTAITEKILPDFLSELRADSASIARILKPWPFKAEIEEMRAAINSVLIRQSYLFQHYKLKVGAFDQDNQSVISGQTLGYEEIVTDNWSKARNTGSDPDIRFLRGDDGKFRYLLRLSVFRASDVSQPVELFVILEHDYRANDQAYTRILQHRQYKDMDRLSDYSFVVQKNGRIIVEQGRGSLPALAAAKIQKGQSEEIASGDRVDAVARSSDGTVLAAVGHSSTGWLRHIYLFSLLFTLISLLLLGLASANSLLNFLPEEYDFRLTAKGSLARRIHLWNVSLLAAAFLVIGFLTYRHFVESARETARADFAYRAEAVQNHLEAPLLNLRDSSGTVSTSSLVRSFTEITGSLGADANLYDTSGEMLYSTRKDLVDLGVISPKMNKAVLENLQKNRAPELDIREAVAGTPYTSQYRPCLSASGDLLGFIGVPNPESRIQIGSEVSNFIGMLASLYVFLLLIAYAVTYALSRSIIRPLSLLSEKVQELKFTDKNDPLVYAGDNQDEISELIAQYNAMVAKLEDSKLQLVRLEREGAWREMARQVAHDIKNPLTTMKLSMQQLERVSSNPEQAAAYLRKAITRLIEQIDSLAQIASEFSMFANLDIRQKSDVVVNEVVENVHDLFSEQRNVHLDLSLPKEALHIMGDKNHLIRVFNNLVINAIQAIPSDREGKINVAVLNQNGLAVIKISDNGGGIPPEIRDRVFEPNFTTKTSGSGLGLAICKKIIEAHDGNIRFETRENEGTDFFVEIPVSSVA